MQSSQISPFTTNAAKFRKAAPQPGQEAPQQPSESVDLGRSRVAPGLQTYSQASISSAENKPEPEAIHEHKETGGLGPVTRAVVGVMAGLTMVTALTGCGQGPSVTNPEHTEAQKELSDTFTALEKQMKENEGEEVGTFADKAFRAIADYGRQTGQKGDALMNDLAGVIRKHPAIAATVAITAGTAIGLGLEHFGVTDSIGDTAGEVLEWVKENPWKTAAIGIGIVASGALIYNYLIKPQAEVPQKPTGAEAEAMEKTFEQLEQELKTHEGDPKEKAAEVTKTLTQRIKDYAAATGRSASEVKDDVTAWAYDHPIVATSLVMAGGVGLGVVLGEMGVPETVAGWAGQAVDASSEGFGKVGEFMKEHPVISGAIAAGVAAGAGYAIYQVMN